MRSVDLVLATYQSERFLRPLLASLAAQTFTQFRLIVSDDSSTDDTLPILDEFQEAFRDMELHCRESPSGSAKANFAGLLQLSDADFTLFVDADDIWDPDKVAKTVETLVEGERKSSANVPRYAFSDARIIDGNGAVTQASFWRYKKLRPSSADSPAQALVCAPMLGCLSGINRALRELVTPVPVDAVTGHDWWALLVAKFLGEIDVIDEKLASYRIHGGNSSAQKRVSVASYAVEDSKTQKVRRGMELRRLQAMALLDRFRGKLSAENEALLREFVRIDRMGFFEKRRFLLRERVLYPDLARNIAMLVAA